VNTIHRQASVVTNSNRTERRRRRARTIVACAIGPIVAALAPRATAGVQLSSVAAGAASVSQNGSITTIRTATNNTILYFSKFDVATGSAVNFLQPSVAGRVLDHVTSATPSLINGTIQSNGSVYLINPAGVIFGAGAVVDVNRFYAAASSFSNQDFLAGVDHFTNVSGLVSNSGEIRANQVSLIGSQVINQGSIIAPNGVVAMLAGPDVLISQQGSHITAKVAPPAAMTLPIGSTPAGSPRSTSLDVRSSALAAGDVYSLAIRHSGVIQASNVLINGGQGQVQISGSIDASTNAPGGVGGTVAITGGQVNLVSATINASGPGGGGTVQIGGGEHGSGDLPHAQNVSADANTTIDADATSNGDGGTVVLWSDGTTSFAATLTARGGPLGGNGGLIETSGDFLQVSGTPNASAPHGTAGTWLMDPINIEIVNGTSGATSFPGPTVDNQDVEAVLESGTSVVIDTSNQDVGGNAGTLLQDATAPIAVTLSSGNVSLTLRGNSNMTLSGGITASGSNSLSVELDQLNSSGSAITIDTNPININGTLTIVGGNLTVASTSGLTAANIVIGPGNVTPESGTPVSLTMGTIAINGPVVTNVGTFNSTGSTSFTSTSTGTINTTASANGVVAISSTGATTIGGAITAGSSTGEVDISATGPISISAAIATGTAGVYLDFGNSGAAAPSASGTISTSAAITTGGGGVFAGGISFNSATGGTIATATGPVEIEPSTGISIGATINTGGGAFTAAGQSFASTAAISIGTASNSPFSINTSSSSTGTINIAGAITWAGTAGVTIAGGNNVITTAAGAITSTGAAAMPVSLSTTSALAILTIGGSVDTSGAFTANGGVFTLNATGGLIAQSVSIDLATSAPGTVTIDEPVVTTNGAFQADGTGFDSNAPGTISTSGGGVTLAPSTGITIAAAITTGGGAFTATGQSFTSTASIGIGTASNSVFSINTSSSSTGTISIGGAIGWAGTGGVDIEGGNAVITSTAGTINSTGSASMPVSLFTTGSSVPITVGGTVNTSGAFTASGGNFSLTAASGLTAGSASINFVTTTTLDGKTVTPLIVNIAATVTTSGPFQTGGTSFTSTSAGAIATLGGDVTINSSTGILIGAEIDTFGGNFTATANGNFENDAPLTFGAGPAENTAFSINTISSSTGTININGAISWAGTRTGGVTIAGATDVTVTSLGSVTTTGNAIPISIYTTAVDSSFGTLGIVLSGTVSAAGTLTVSGGNFSLSDAVPINATSISLNVATSATGIPTITPGTVTISGPVTTGSTLTPGGSVAVGGVISLIDNQGGAITTNGGSVAITNTGLITLGNAVNTSGATPGSGGSFSVTGASSFTDSNGPITTDGGNVNIDSNSTDGNDIAAGSPINTGGGTFNLVGQSFELDSNITDGGVAAANGVLAINTTSGTGAITINGTISWAGGTNRQVLIEGGGDVIINGTITSTGATPLPVSIYTSGTTNNVMINAAVNISGFFIESGADFTVATTGALTAQFVNVNSITSSPDIPTITPGTVTISGPLITSGGAFTAGGADSFIDNQSGTITTNGGAVVVTNTGIVTFGSTVVTGGGPFTVNDDNTFTSSANGIITTNGGAVIINSTGSIISTTGEISIGAEINTGGGSFSSTGVTFSNTAEITDGGVNHSQALTITATEGDITIGGDIDWSTNLGPMTFSVPSLSNLSLGATITANPAEPIDFSGVNLSLTGTNSTITGGNITFGAITNPDNTTEPTLTVQSAGTVILNAVGTSAAPIGAITVTKNGTSAAPPTILNGDIDVSESVQFDGVVTLATNINIFGLTESGISGRFLEFNNTVEGPGGLTMAVAGTFGDAIAFNSNVGDVTPLAYLEISLGAGGIMLVRPGSASTLPGPDSPQPLTTFNIASGGNIEINDVTPPVRNPALLFSPLLATIDSYGPLSFNIGSAASPNASNLFAVGQDEKITAFGDLSISTNGGTAVIGDLNAFGDLSIDAARVQFVLRAPTVENNTKLDTGMDLIADGEITLPAGAVYSTIAPSGAGTFDVPGFVARSFNASSNISAIAAQLNTVISIIPSISSAALFGADNLLLDLTPSTLGATIPTFIPPIPFVFDYPIAGAAPRQQLVAGTVTPDFKEAFAPVYPGPIVQQELNDSGAYTREPTLQEILDATDSIVVYDDLPTRRRPRPQDYATAVNRLDSRRVQEFLVKYREMFYGGAGNVANMPSRKPQIAADLQEAWDAYVSQNGYRPATGAGFQQYCARTPSATKASAELTQLSGLLGQLDTLGLSHKEAREAFQHNILAGLPANGMQDSDLIAAVENAGNVK
jgi:filamentous hemagglutinin family protein